MSSRAEEPTAGLYRASRPQVFMGVALLYSQRSSCPRASVGAVATRMGRIIATGYVGAPSGLPHCLDVGCLMVDGHCIRSVHAEANMVAWAAREGLSLKGSVVYCTHMPCHACTKLLANAGIIELVYDIEYDNRDGHSGRQLLYDLHIPAKQFDASRPR